MLIRLLRTRLQQGYRTRPYPPRSEDLPERFVGTPELSADPEIDWEAIVPKCPTSCLEVHDNKPRIDLGKCIFCRKCSMINGREAVQFTRDYRQAVFDRRELIYDEKLERHAAMKRAELQKIFKRSLKIRLINAGDCGSCTSNVSAMMTPDWDVSRFGISFDCSPKHADALLITGPVSANMVKPLQKAYDTLANPKLVIACGACAISGGIYEGSPECSNGIGKMFPVDLYIPGCPPHPLVLIEGLLNLMGRNKKSRKK